MLVAIAVNNTKVMAFDFFENTDGESIPVELEACVIGNTEGCGGLSQNFVIRVTVVDQNRNKIDGTQTIQFYTDDNYNLGDYWTYVDITDNNDPHWAANASFNENASSNYSFVGSSIAKINGQRSDMFVTSNPEYQVYMGFTRRPNDFSTYAANRTDFINYSQKIKTYKIGVPGIGKVNFIDFVFKMTGMSAKYGFRDGKESWNASSNLTILKSLSEDGKKGKKYYLLIEPVYWSSMEHNGKSYSLSGTAKQIAEAYLQNTDKAWFWPMLYYENAYNLVCNFIERSGELGFKKGNTSLCNNINNFKFASDIVVPESSCQGTSWLEQFTCKLENAISNFLNTITDKFQNSTTFNAYKQLADPDSVFGVNIINLSKKLIDDNPIAQEKTNQCIMRIFSCTDNSFQYSSKLSVNDKLDGDIFDCIYPSQANKMSKDQMKSFSTQYEDLDLWCYDDVNYNFKELYKSFTNSSQTYRTNQLIHIPSGTLTVERKCFTKKNYNAGGAMNLSSVFESDDARYQPLFYLEFNGKNYQYVRGNKYQTVDQTKDNTEKTSNFDYTIEEKTSKNKEKYYEISSSFTYDYKLKDVYDVTDRVGILLNDYSITDVISTNSMEFITNSSNKGNIIINSNIKTGEYKNQISTSITAMSTKLNNGFGMANNFYKSTSKGTHKTTSNDRNTADTWSKQVVHDESFYKFTNEYIVSEQRGNYCEFKTKTENKNIDVVFRVISLTNPFPARDGTTRMPAKNWLTTYDNNVSTYIENNRNVKSENKDASAEAIYQKEPLYTITLTPSTMVKIREYNKSHTYTDFDMTCETGTGRMCIDNFIRNNKYLSDIEGTCSSINAKEITEENNKINNFLKTCTTTPNCKNRYPNVFASYDKNNDGEVNEKDYLSADFYTCADKTHKSGG